MRKVIVSLALILFIFAAGSLRAENLSTAEFRQMYDSLLAGKTLATQAEKVGRLRNCAWNRRGSAVFFMCADRRSHSSSGSSLDQAMV